MIRSAQLHRRAVIQALVIAGIVGLGGKTVMATLLVVIHEAPNGFLLAIDSKRTDAVTPGREQVACKMIRTRPFVFTGSGMMQDTQGFDLNGIAVAVSRVAGDLDTKVAALDSMAIAALDQVVANVRQQAPARALDLLRREMTNVVVAGVASDGAVLFERTYGMKADMTSTEVTFRRRSTPRPDGFTMYGEQDVVASVYQLVQRQAPSLASAEAVARIAIEEGIRLKPQKSGHPIAMVRISRAGIDWVRRPEGCPDLQD